MKKLKQEKGVTLVALVITIIVLLILAGITINLIFGEDGIITKAVEAGKTQKIAEIKEKIGLDLLDADTQARLRGEKLEQVQKEDIASKYGELQEDGDTLNLKDVDATVSLKEIWNGETATTGSYTENKEKIEELQKRIEELEKALEDSSKTESEKAQELAALKTELAKVTAKEDRILKGYTAYKLDSGIITGTMADNGTLSATLKAGESYTVQTGFAQGGTITALDLASQTVADATASDIAQGKTAWINGIKIIGTNKLINPTVIYYEGSNQTGANSYGYSNSFYTSYICGDDITIQEKSFKFNRAGTVYLDCYCSYSSSSGNISGVTSYIQVLKNDVAVKEFSNGYTNSNTHNVISLEVEAGDVLSFKGKCSQAFWWQNKVIMAF